jgi:hypothetical protein
MQPRVSFPIVSALERLKAAEADVRDLHIKLGRELAVAGLLQKVATPKKESRGI